MSGPWHTEHARESISPSRAAAERVGRYRYVVIGILWLTFCVGAFDRAGISLLLVDPGFLRDMGLEGSPERQGLVMSMMLLPYALSNIFLSPSADRWGPRRVLALMSAFWVGAALLLSIAWSYPVLLAGRIVRGLAEGPLFPVANRYVRFWFPPSERGAANAIWTSGQRMGLAFAVPVLAAAIGLLGWRFSFFLQAAMVTLAVLPAVWFLTADRPEMIRRVGSAERNYIAATHQQEKSGGWQRALPAILRSYRYWLAILYHFAVLALYFGLVTWLPKYLSEARGFDIAQVVLFASLPHLCSTATSLAFGIYSDRVGRRAVFCAASLAGASAAVCMAAFSADPVASGILMTLGFGIWGVGSPAYYAIMQRIVPASIMATGIGIDNGLANFGSALAPVAVGFLIGATGSYLAGLLFLATLGLLGSLALAALAAQGY